MSVVANAAALHVKGTECWLCLRLFKQFTHKFCSNLVLGALCKANITTGNKKKKLKIKCNNSQTEP